MPEIQCDPVRFCSELPSYLGPRLIDIKKARGFLHFNIFFSFWLFVGTSLFTPLFCSPGVNGISIWTSTSDLDFNSTGCVFNNIVIKDIGAAASIQLDRAADWWKKDIQVPPARAYYAMASIGIEDKVLLFGGYTGSEALDDTWIFDSSNNKWTLMNPLNAPLPRYDHAMATIFKDDKVILFGGFFQSGSGPRIDYNDTWIYDLSDNQWYKQNPLDSPSARCGHIMSGIDTVPEVLLFGGYSDDLGFFCDTWVFNITDCRWREIFSLSKPGANLVYSMANIRNDDKVVTFMGRKLDKYLNETWVYDRSDGQWTMKDPPEKPSARDSFAMATVVNMKGVMLFGGYDGASWQCDTWIYDLSSDRWNQANPIHYPFLSDEYQIAAVFTTDAILLFGGINRQTWIYYPSAFSQMGDYLSPYYDTGGASSYISICWSAAIPTNTSVELQLRTAATKDEMELEPFTGSDDTPFSFYLNGSAISEEHHGDRWIQYRVHLETKDPVKTPMFNEVVISYDRLPSLPAPAKPGVGSWINNSRPTFEWYPNDSDSLYQNGFEWQMRGKPHSDWLEYSSGEVESTSSNFTPERPIDDGTWYWRVRTKDIENNWGPFSDYWAFGIDTVPPHKFAANLIPKGWTSGQCQLLFNTSDEGSGLDYYVISIDNEFLGNQTSPFLLPDLPDGAHSITVGAHDRAGNVMDSHVWAYIDRSLPEPFTPEVDYLSWTNTLPTIIFSTTDNNSGIDHFEIQIDNDPFLVQSSPYRLSVITDGQHTITVRAFDAAGNYRDDTLTVFIDRTSPGNILIAISPNGWTNTNPNITFTTTDLTSGIDHYEINKNNGTFTCQTSPYTFVNLLEGSNTITVRAYDKAGNFADAQVQAYIDRSTPDAFVPITSGGNWTKIAPTISFSTNDSISGMDHYEMKIDEGPFMKRTSPFTLPILPDGSHNITVRAFDKAGNFIDGTIVVYLDMSPPTGVFLKIDKGARTTGSDYVTLSLLAIDNASGLDQMCFSNDGIKYSPWEPFATAKSWKLASGYGERTVYIKIKDHAGNEATPESTRITKDAANQWIFPVSILILLISAIIIVYGAFRYIKSRK
jgi:N-acetylneuraminic acid mutarotase